MVQNIKVCCNIGPISSSLSFVELNQVKGNNAGAPPVNISYRWCRDNCRGWQISKDTTLNQWVSPFVGFLVPAVVFCLAIPRRRKLHIPEILFDIALNEVTTHFRTPFIALSAALLVTIDTISWLMTIFALSGPILVSGIYEAYIDGRMLAYLQEKVRNKRLSTSQRSRLLYTILVGNLDMLNFPQGEDPEDNPLNHVESLVSKLDRSVIDYKYPQKEKVWFRTRAIAKTKTRLRTMLAAQYSFGVTVGAPIIFFCGSFAYTLVDNYSNLGDNNTSHALGQFRSPNYMSLLLTCCSIWYVVDDCPSHSDCQWSSISWEQSEYSGGCCGQTYSEPSDSTSSDFRTSI